MKQSEFLCRQIEGDAVLFGTQDRSLEEYAASVGKSVDAARSEYNKLLQAQSDVLDNAAKAFRTAGLSQNEYMETVTSFSAALIASLGGDTLKAAEVADKAIVDMADNANKMGSSMESIQNAYQGFAKQNYTMLDNLKLGYGGTKSEMERLLADAEAISGVHYDIESYADVVEAIHVIQDEMGITGTTAKEAAETISGSVASAKSAWSNMVVGIADENQDFEKLASDFLDSAATAAENIIPRIGTIIGGMGKLVESMSSVLGDIVTSIVAYIPDLVEAGVSLIDALVQGLVDNAPALVMEAAEVIQALVNTIGDSLPTLVQAALDIIVSLAKAIVAAALPDLIVVLVENLPTIIVAIVETLIEAIPQILEAAMQMFMAIVEAIPEILVALVTGLGELPGKIWDNLTAAIKHVISWGLELREKAKTAASDMFHNIVDTIKELPGKMLELGKNMVEGLWNGIKNMGQWIKDKIFGFADGIIFLCL